MRNNVTTKFKIQDQAKSSKQWNFTRYCFLEIAFPGTKFIFSNRGYNTIYQKMQWINYIPGRFCAQWNIEFFKRKPDSFQVLLILHAIDEIPTNHICLIRKGIVGTVNNSFAFFFAQNFLVTLCTSDVFRIRLYEVWKREKIRFFE